jgi:hypothetical protein
MHELVAEVDLAKVRLCKLKTQIFEGYVRVAPDEEVEVEEEGGEEVKARNVDFILHRRRVMSEELIRRAHAFRMSVSRAQAECGIKTEHGIICGERGFAEMKKLYGEFAGLAAEIQQEMERDIDEHGGAVELAKCVIEFVSLRLVQDEASAGASTQFFSEAVEEQLGDIIEAVNKAVGEISRLVGVGNVPRARRQADVVERKLQALERRGWDDSQIAPLREDLTAIRAVLNRHVAPVEEKLRALGDIDLMQGLRMRKLLDEAA